LDDGAVDEISVSHLHGLTGKPDYILREGEELIPVEHKSRLMSAAGAYEGEILQLAAYCLLVEERFGKAKSRRSGLPPCRRSCVKRFTFRSSARNLSAGSVNSPFKPSLHVISV
jgi:hypothetical protein